MKKCYYCILVLASFGYPYGSPSGLSVNVSNIHVSIILSVCFKQKNHLPGWFFCACHHSDERLARLRSR